MLFVKYFLSMIGFGLLIGAASILIYDLYQIFKPRGTKKQPPLSLAEPLPAPEHFDEPRPFVLRWRLASQIAAVGLFPLLMGMSITLIPAGHAGGRVSQFWGTLPGTLYPGVHWIAPLAERVELFNTRDHVFTTS